MGLGSCNGNNIKTERHVKTDSVIFNSAFERISCRKVWEESFLKNINFLTSSNSFVYNDRIPSPADSGVSARCMQEACLEYQRVRAPGPACACWGAPAAPASTARGRARARAAPRCPRGSPARSARPTRAPPPPL